MKLTLVTGAILAWKIAEARESITGDLTHLCTMSLTNAQGGEQEISNYVTSDIAEQCTGCQCREIQVVCLIGPDSNKEYVKKEEPISYSLWCDSETCTCSNHTDFQQLGQQRLSNVPPPLVETEDLTSMTKDEFFEPDGSLKVGDDIKEIAPNTMVCVIGPYSQRYYVKSLVSVNFSKSCDHEICFCSNHADF